MKRNIILLTVALIIALCPIAILAQEEEYNFADHTILVAAIEREWRNQNLYTAYNDGHPDIRAYFLGFAQAYPNELLNYMVNKMIGIDSDESGGPFVLDLKNGYIGGEWWTQLTVGVQMCYWHTTDGNVIIAVAFNGHEYKDGLPVCDSDEDSDDDYIVNISDLMFYKVIEDQLLWRPVTPEQMLGRSFDFKHYDVDLPRTGKDIILTGNEPGDGNYTLRWTGTGFTVAKKK